MAPTIEEQIAWLRELHAFQARQYGTLIKTGRMSGLMAQTPQVREDRRS